MILSNAFARNFSQLLHHLILVSRWRTIPPHLRFHHKTKDGLKERAKALFEAPIIIFVFTVSAASVWGVTAKTFVNQQFQIQYLLA